PLTGEDQSEQSASAVLANVMICESADGNGAVKQFPPPPRFVATLLKREPTRNAFPQVRQYSRRPVFDEQFVLRGPGWHESVGILVHGVDIEPADFGRPIPSDVAAIDRLPEYLRTLLSDFCFQSDADLANAVAALVTGLLVTHFVVDGKPVFL